MRIEFVLTLLLVATLCFAAPKAGGSVKIALPGKKVLTVSQQCLENAVDVCGSPSEDQKYFERFTRTADQVEQINQKNAGWIAGHNKFSTVSDDDIDLRSGSYLLEERGIKNTAPVVSSRTNTGRKLHATLPESFDARIKWPKCVSAIRSQGNCGCCWAYAAASVLQDRACIQSNGKIQGLVLSTQDAVSCSGVGGCNEGGNPSYFFSYLNKTGILEEACQPYASSKIGTGPDVACPTLCANKSPIGQAIRHTSTRATQFKGRDVIKQEIMTNGPLTMQIRTYTDMMQYKSGIYKVVLPTPKGRHATKVIGWGKDPLTKAEYWIIANSWGQSWGENGYFRLLMGECESEKELWGATYTGSRKGPLPNTTGKKF